MKQIMKRGLALLLCLLMALAIAGCGENPNPPASSEAAESEAAPEAEAENAGEEAGSDEERVTVTFRTWNPSPPEFEEFVIPAWNEKGTNIDIELVQVQYSDHIQTLKVNVASGEGPDIYGIQVGAIMKEFQEFTLDIAPKAEETWGADWESKFNPAYMEQVKGNLDSYYGLPLGGLYAGFMWSNSDYLNKYNIEVAHEYSYDDLVAACKTLRDNGEYPLMIGAKDDWINLDVIINIASDINADKFFSALEGEVPFTDPEIVQAFEIWKSCFDDGVFQDGALGVNVYSDVSDPWENQLIGGLYCNGSWFCGGLYSNPTIVEAEENGAVFTPFNVDWNNDGKAAPVAPAVDVVACVSNESKHPDETWEVFSWLVTDGVQTLIDRRLQYLPGQAGVEIKAENFNEPMVTALNHILEKGETDSAGYREITYPELKQTIADELKAIALGEHTPEEACAVIEEASQKQER